MEILRDSPIDMLDMGEESQSLPERLRYGTPFHQEIADRLQARLTLSSNHISQRYDDWDRADEHIQMYVDLSRGARRGNKTLDTNKREMPFQRSIVVPMSYSILQVRLTALMALFGAREPMIQVEGRGPEDVAPAKMLEALIAYDLEQTQGMLAWYGFLQNAEKYGLGIMYDYFEKEQGWTTQPTATNPLQALFAQAMGLPQTQQVWGTTREFSRWTVVDPFAYRPDPRVPGSNVQEMEFVGHECVHAWNYILERSDELGGPWMNVKALRRMKAQRREGQAQGRMREVSRAFDLQGTADERDRGAYLVAYIQIKLVPQEWRLSPETRPETWQFVLGEDAVVLEARKRDNAHGQYSYSVAQTHYDPHVAFAPSLMENIDGIQRLANWFYGSHTESVQRFLNDALVYGASWIEENELLNPGPARHIRLTRHGEELVERGMMTPQQMVQQLAVGDVTQGHLREVQTLFDMIQRMTGVNDPAMGQPTESKRTLGEIQRILVSSSRRMATQAQLYDLQALQPLAQRLIADRQQYTSQQQYIRITGRLAQEMQQERLFTRKENIQGNFDYMPISGLMPPDPERVADTWANFMAVASKMPQLLQPGPDGRVLDPRWIFRQFAQTLGLKNIEDAFIQVQPDPRMAQMAQAGNAVPMGAVPPGGGPIPGAGIQGPMVPGGIVNGAA